MPSDERRTAVSDLRLSVYLRSLHPEFFTIRARQALRGLEFTGEIWLLDPGHVIAFVDGPSAVTEVIAPRRLELPPRGLVRAVDLNGESEEEVEARGILVYRMAYHLDAQDQATYLREAEELLAGARGEAPLAESPREAARRPFSYAVPDARADGLLVHTWHGFPEERTILKTQTLIERA